MSRARMTPCGCFWSSFGIEGMGRSWSPNTPLSSWQKPGEGQDDIEETPWPKAQPLFFRRVLDRIKSGCVEPEQVPRLLHVLRQRRGGVDDAAARMRDDNATREQVQTVLQAAWQLPILDIEIFGIADDGVADVFHVGAELVGAAGDRFQGHPGQLVAGSLDHRIVGHRVARALIAMLGDAHDGVVLAFFLCEESRDAALLRL